MAFRLAEAYVQFSQRGLRGVQGHISGISRQFSGAIGTVGRFATALGGLSAVGTAGAMLKMAADAETLETQLRVMLGSGDAAKRMLEQINEFSNKTPFENMDVAAAAQQLLKFQIPADQVFKHLKSVGDVAALTGNRISDLATMYGKMTAGGRVMTEDLNQLTDAGVPAVLAEFEKQFGLVGQEDAGVQLRKLASEGKITADNLVKAFRDITGAGGMFEDGMEQLAETTSGKFSTVVGTIKSEAAELGQVFLPVASNFLDDILAIVQSDSIQNAAEDTAKTVASFMDQVAGAFGRVVNHADDIIDVFGGVVAGAEITFGAAGQVADVFSDVWDTLSDGSDAYDLLEGRPWEFADEFADAAADVKAQDRGLLNDIKYTARHFGDLWKITTHRMGIYFANTYEKIRAGSHNIKTFFKSIVAIPRDNKTRGELAEVQSRLAAVRSEVNAIVLRIHSGRRIESDDDNIERLLAERNALVAQERQLKSQLATSVPPMQDPTLLDPDEDPEIKALRDKIDSTEAGLQVQREIDSVMRFIAAEERKQKAADRQAARDKARNDIELDGDKRKENRKWKILQDGLADRDKLRAAELDALKRHQDERNKIRDEDRRGKMLSADELFRYTATSGFGRRTPQQNKKDPLDDRARAMAAIKPVVDGVKDAVAQTLKHLKRKPGETLGKALGGMSKWIQSPVQGALERLAGPAAGLMKQARQRSERQRVIAERKKQKQEELAKRGPSAAQLKQDEFRKKRSARLGTAEELRASRQKMPDRSQPASEQSQQAAEQSRPQTAKPKPQQRAEAPIKSQADDFAARRKKSEQLMRDALQTEAKRIGVDLVPDEPLQKLHDRVMEARKKRFASGEHRQEQVVPARSAKKRSDSVRHSHHLMPEQAKARLPIPKSFAGALDAAARRKDQQFREAGSFRNGQVPAGIPSQPMAGLSEELKSNKKSVETLSASISELNATVTKQKSMVARLG